MPISTSGSSSSASARLIWTFLVFHLLHDFAHDQHFEVAALGVEMHLHALVGLDVAGVRLRQRLLESLDQRQLIDVSQLRDFTQRLGKIGDIGLGHFTSLWIGFWVG